MTRASLHRVLRERIEASAAAGVLMAASSLVLRLLDIIEAIEHIRGETVASRSTPSALTGASADRSNGVETISEASRHLTDELQPGLELLPN